MSDISIPDVMRFCKIWRTRQEIREEFELSPVSSWNLVKKLRCYKQDFMVQKNVGKTGRCEMYKTRYKSLEALENGEDV